MYRDSLSVTIGQYTDAHMVTELTLPAISHGVDTLHGSRREIRKGKQTSYFCTKNAASELEGGTGIANVMDVVSEFGGGSGQWLNVLVTSG